MPSSSAIPYFCSLVDDAVAVYTPGATEQAVGSIGFRKLAVQVLEAAQPLVQQAGSAVHFTGVQVLSAGMRSVVLRVFCQGFSSQSFILKYFRRHDSASNSGGFGYLREKHGLVALDRLVPRLYPRLYAASDEARLLVLEDVTASFPAASSLGGTLLSSPTGQDAGTQQALDIWVDVWAMVLTSSAQANAQAFYSRALSLADPQATSPGALPSPRLAFKGLELLALQENVALGSAEFARHEEMVHSIIYPGTEDRVLSSGDFSPANLLALTSEVAGRAPGNPVLASVQNARGIDAEGTCWHHWALPVAELILGFPSWPEGPLPASMVHSETWQTATQRFYQRVAPAPLTGASADPRVHAALLTVRAILAEQKGKNPVGRDIMQQ
ncbi:MAG: hypothetical protein Q3965_03390 [Rothia sp. (in: high G+C Gram-positive bacteria)]|nr:hypothetical protein [Rothia sp. (in: high G+C Gram-positive bacteria)]